jgi:hypothetical protein
MRLERPSRLIDLEVMDGISVMRNVMDRISVMKEGTIMKTPGIASHWAQVPKPPFVAVAGGAACALGFLLAV